MADEETELDEIPKKSKLPIVIVILVVNLLGIGGAVFFLSSGKDDQPAETEKKGKEKKRAATEGPGPLIPIKGFVVNLTGAEGKNYLKVEVSVELFAEEDVEPFQKFMPLVRNELLMNMMNLDVERVSTLKGRRALERKLAKLINKRIKSDFVSGVFFTEFVTQ